MNKFEGGDVEAEVVLVYFDSPAQIERYWGILKKGFRHVAICLPIRIDGQIAGHVALNYSMALAQATIITTPLGEAFPGATFQFVKARRNYGDQPFALCMFATCVSLAKMFLGIRGQFIWTPYQLFKFVRNCNGHLG